MRTRIALPVLMLAAALGACGGSTEQGIVQPTTPVGAATSATSPGARGARVARGARGARDRAAGTSCAARGITTPPFNEGACLERGTRFVVAHGRSVVRLRTLSASLAGFSVAESIGEATPQQGAFVLIRLDVVNRTGRPQSFASGQTQLVVGGQAYEEAGHVEQNARRDALAYAERAPIQPGERAIGEVVYEVPIDQIERVTREGVLALVNFDGNPKGERAEIGHFLIFRG